MSAADLVVGIIFDAATGKPVAMGWQIEHGGHVAVHAFFHPDDCQAAAPARPNLVMGTVSDWHRMGISLVRQRNKGGRRGGSKRGEGIP